MFGIAYVVRDASGEPDETGNHHFAVYESGVIRHIGGDEAAHILSADPQLRIVNEHDRGALADLFRDSATHLRPPWWQHQWDVPPYDYTLLGDEDQTAGG